MLLRWLSILFLVLAAAPSASAQSNADPFNERYIIRGVEPHNYLGYGEYLNRVWSLVREYNQLDLPPDREFDFEAANELANFSILTSSARRTTRVRLLNVRIAQGNSSRPNTVEAHLKWPSDTRAFDTVRNAYPFVAIRRAFERSGLSPDAPEWIAQRNQFWPDAPSVARRVIVSDRPLDVAACPNFLAALERLRDEPPALELIPHYAGLRGQPDRESDTLPTVRDGWSLSFMWDGGPDFWDNGGRARPRQDTDLGRALLHLVGDAEECAGIERTMPVTGPGQERPPG